MQGTVDYLQGKITGGVSFDDIYPIGSIYISMTAGTTADLPSAFTADGRQWTRIGSARCLWGAAEDNSNLGNTLDGSLPNITGTFSGAGQSNSGIRDSARSVSSGAFYVSSVQGGPQVDNSNEHDDVFGFQASRSNSIYKAAAGKNIVRPTSIAVAFWQRTA